MLSGSIQFSIPFQFNTNHAFIKIMPLYNVYVECKRYLYNYTFQIFFFFAFRFVISHMAIESTFPTDSVGESCSICHSVAM